MCRQDKFGKNFGAEVYNGFAETDLDARVAPLEALDWPRFLACVVSAFHTPHWLHNSARAGVGWGLVGLPGWLKIMTCEPIKQLIRNSSDADDDEGEEGENFITTFSPPPPPPQKKQQKKHHLSRVIKADVNAWFRCLSGFLQSRCKPSSVFMLRNNACLGFLPNPLYYTLVKKSLMQSNEAC